MGSGSPGGFASPPAGSAGSCSVPVHIELTEMLRCPETHEEALLVMSTGGMGGIHGVGIDAPSDVEELPVLSLLACETMIPLRRAMARAVVVGPERASPPWLGEALRVLLRGRRLVIEDEGARPPAGVKQLAVGQGLWVGERG